MRTDVLVALVLLMSVPLIGSLLQALVTSTMAVYSSSAMDIWAAAAAGSVDIVKVHLENRADPNSLDKFGKSPLHWAVERGHAETVELLLEYGADANLKDINGEPPLSMAAMRGSRRLTELLLQKGAEMNVAAAALVGDYRFFEAYLARKENLYLPHANMSLLHLVASRGDYPEIVQLLIDRGADVNSQDRWSATPLTYAASFGHARVAKLLLSHGSRINAQSEGFQTPLHHAVNGGHLHAVTVLVEHGADVNAGGNGGPPLCRAADKGHVEIADLLIEHGAGLDGGQTAGMTPLHLASRGNHLSVAELLLSKGANIDARYGLLGWTPLFFAQSTEMADLLRAYGASSRMYWWAALFSG